MSDSRRCAILLVSWNARDHLARCLRALAALDPPTAHEIIVVDNASNDGSADMVATDFPAVHLLRADTNLGFAAAVNAGRSAATADALLLLNTDTEALPDSVDRLLTVLHADASLGAVTGRLVDAVPDGVTGGATGGGTTDSDGERRVMPQRDFHIRRFPTLTTWAVDLLLIDKLWPGNPETRRYLARDLDPDRPADVEQPAAACLLIRTRLFDDLGGLDAGFHPAWFEDVDFCQRVARAGFRIRYEPSAVFVHRGGVAMDRLGLAAFSRIWYRNLTRYARKHHGRTGAASVTLLIVAGMCLRMAVSLLRGDRAALAAYAGVLAQTVRAR